PEWPVFRHPSRRPYGDESVLILRRFWMNTDEAGQERPGVGEPTAVLPETAAQLVELERLQQALAEAEERARSHWEQYLRAVAEPEDVGKRAQRASEAPNRSGLE